MSASVSLTHATAKVSIFFKTCLLLSASPSSSHGLPPLSIYCTVAAVLGLVVGMALWSHPKCVISSLLFVVIVREHTHMQSLKRTLETLYQVFAISTVLFQALFDIIILIFVYFDS